MFASRASRPVRFVGRVAQAVPGGRLEFRLQTLSSEGRIAEPEDGPPPLRLHEVSQALFHEGAKRDTPAVRHATGVVQEAVGNLKGRLHVATHVLPDGSQESR